MSVECPECHGKGGSLVITHVHGCGMFLDDEANHHFHFASCSERWDICRVCNGVGTVDMIQRAVYMARGGAAPVQTRGYA